MSVPDVPPVPALPARRPEDGFAPFNPPLEPGLRVSNNNAGHESVPRIPKNLTATYAEVSFGIGQQKYDMDGNMETWFEASIKGAVTNVEEALTVKEHLETALDVMILVDNSYVSPIYYFTQPAVCVSANKTNHKQESGNPRLCPGVMQECLLHSFSSRSSY
jgi:hypothetical protein